MKTELKNTELSSIEINPPQSTQNCIIWLHGLGADGNDFVPIAHELNLNNTRFVFPHAPFQPITINQGYVMRAWYDIVSMQIDQKIDETSIYESVKLIEALIKKENARGVPTEKIVLAGFSQGAVVALITGLCYPERLGGILSLSGYLPLPHKLAKEVNIANQNIPIFLAHGTEDTVVPYSLCIMLSDFLKQHHYTVEMHHYAMGHSVCEEEINDITNWLQRVV